MIHHTDRGMLTFTDEIMRQLLAKSLQPAILGPDGWEDVGPDPGSREGNFLNWMTFSDLPRSVVEDVARLRKHLVPPDIPIYGCVSTTAPLAN